MSASAVVSTLVILAGVAQAAPAVVPAVAPHMNSPVVRRQVPSPPEGFYNTLFSDDFTGGNGTIDESVWTYDLGTSYPGGPANWGTGEIQSYTSDPSNIWINTEGNLVITPQSSYGAWTSARIETTEAYDVACPEGGRMRVEAKIKVGEYDMDPATQMGIWPAFWMLGSDFRGTYDWPAQGEIDILETANGEDTIWHTVHCGTAPGGVCNENNGIGGSAEGALSRGDWHTITFEIDRVSSNYDEQALIWYVDGAETFRLTTAEVSYDTGVWESLAVNSKFILLNVAVGGGFPNGIAGGYTTPDAYTVGGESVDMEIEYVAVWST